MKIPENEAVSQQETRQNCPVAVGEKVAISISEALLFLFLRIKSGRSNGK
jgi:hypothetical protein